MKNVNPQPRGGKELRQQVREAYLGHRLNNQELGAMTKELQEVEQGHCSQAQAKKDLDHYTEITTDWRGESPMSLAEAQAALNLISDFKALKPDAVWSPTQRAIYRRLSAPDNDPVPPGDKAKSGDPAFVETALRIFEKIDRDHNLRVTTVELDAAMRKSDWQPDEAAALALLRRKQPQLSSCVSDGTELSTEDLKAFLASGIPNDSKSTLTINNQMASLTKKAAAMQPAGPLMEEDFDPENVTQGRAGSCVMLSTEAGTSSETIRSMFSDNHDGTYTVAFKDGKSETVAEPTLCERLYHASSPNGGRWPALMEIAMGQRLFKAKPASDGSFRTSINGQPVETTIAAFSGYPSKRYSLDSQTPNQVRALLTELSKVGGPVVCASRSVGGADDSAITVESLKNGIANNHAYTLRDVRYDPSTDMVSLRNPWRRGEWTIKPDGVEDGKFQMPLLDFYSSYRWVAAPVVTTMK